MPPDEHQRLLPRLRLVSLALDEALYEVGGRIDYVYFPCGCVASALNIMQDGSAIETATVGSEGLLGLDVLFGLDTSFHRVIAQVAGNALRMEAEALKEEASQDGPLRRLLLLYHNAFLMQVSQSVACNGLHSVRQRCCRWLLMTRDRVHSDDLPLTHQYLAMMLGVRRPSITEVLHPLHEEGLIRSRRGKIRILDRAGLEAACCECYQKVNDEFARLFG